MHYCKRSAQRTRRAVYDYGALRLLHVCTFVYMTELLLVPQYTIEQYTTIQ